MEQRKYYASAATRINGRGLSKPNEDFFFMDCENHIFILLDGITRVHQEYADAPGESAACDVNAVFSDIVYRYMLEHMQEQEPDELLRNSAIAGNAALVASRSKHSLAQWQFYPGSLGIVAMIRGNRLHYLYTGDCQGTLIRRGAKLHFGQQECTEALEMMKVSKKDRYDIYCNHPENPLGYGIFNGDESAVSLFEQSSLLLESGDTLLLCTDGIARYVRYAKSEMLVELQPEEMIDASARFDVPPFASYADDKTVIKIQF